MISNLGEEAIALRILDSRFDRLRFCEKAIALCILDSRFDRLRFCKKAIALCILDPDLIASGSAKKP